MTAAVSIFIDMSCCNANGHCSCHTSSDSFRVGMPGCTARLHLQQVLHSCAPNVYHLMTHNPSLQHTLPNSDGVRECNSQWHLEAAEVNESMCELYLQLSVCRGFLTLAVSPPLYFFQKMHHFPKPRFSLKHALSEYGSAHRKYRCCERCIACEC